MVFTKKYLVRIIIITMIILIFTIGSCGKGSNFTDANQENIFESNTKEEKGVKTETEMFTQSAAETVTQIQSEPPTQPPTEPSVQPATEPPTNPTTETSVQFSTEPMTAAQSTTAQLTTAQLTTVQPAAATEPPVQPPVRVNVETVFDRNLNNYNLQGTDKITRDFYTLPSYKIQSDNELIINLAKSIVANINTEYEKAKAIHAWVASNIYQDRDYRGGDNDFKWKRIEENPTNALNTAETRFGMCQNFTNLTIALLRAAGIPAKTIFLPDGHTLTGALIDGKWIISDNYFDSNNRYENGRFGNLTAPGNRFFDLSIQDIWDLRAHYFRSNLDFSFYVEDAYFYDNRTLETLILPEGFNSIGRVAFCNNKNLSSIVIPESVSMIGEDAFWGCENLVIYGKPSSYAEIYAEENNIKFEVWEN